MGKDKLKVLFIFLDIHSYHCNEYHFGLAYLSSFLKSKGYDVEYRYVSEQDEFKDILTTVTDYAPDVIGFTAVESQFVHIKRLSGLIREKFRGLMICGGVYVTLYPEALIEADSLDGVIRGEGEYALLQLLENLNTGRDCRETPNFCYYDRGKNRLIKNNLLPLIENLDVLPFPDRAIFDHNAYLNKHHSLQFLFNRGCPFNCTYCSNHGLAQVYGRESNVTRFRSVDNCLKEIGEVLNTYTTNKPLEFIDDLFTLNTTWLFEFLSKYKRDFNRPFVCCTRPNLASDELFARLRDAGCFRVMLSIESGNDFIRNEVMKRNISRGQLLDSFRLARKYGVETSGVAMVGLPFETKEMVWDTIKTIAHTKATDFTLNIFYPYKGTELYGVCKEKGFLKDGDHTIKERRESILSLPDLSKEDILFFHRNCDRLVMRHRPFINRIRFYTKKHLGKLLKATGLMDILKRSRFFLKVRRLIYS